MLTQQRVEEVKRQLRSGVPEGEIKNELLKEGYTEDDMQQLFISHHPDMRSWYLLSAIIFTLAGVYQYLRSESLLLLTGAIIMSVVYCREQTKHTNKK